jgi:hypothetical protein
MKRTAPPVHRVTAGELGALVGASERTLLRLADLGAIRLQSGGGEFMGCWMESVFIVADGEVERLRETVTAMRTEGRLLW